MFFFKFFIFSFKFFFLPKACLGVDAKMGRNMVQITTVNVDDEYTTHTLLSMRFGGTEMVGLRLCLPQYMGCLNSCHFIIVSSLSYCATTS